MESNLGRFITAGAQVMHADRPDIYSVEQAHQELMRWFSELMHLDKGSIGSGGFQLQKETFDDCPEYELVRLCISYNVFPEDEATSTFNWLDSSKVYDLELDLEKDED